MTNGSLDSKSIAISAAISSGDFPPDAPCPLGFMRIKVSLS
eukprot:CAMPEP_0168313802 /NCGR_PEP_ID=MMETSP0210-20121227/4561_1 /TAXON_ID=40633 /ORGANISM="Condylostoma magnum, Strain COL2" /LENGTH=40 /DNA_ID=CAMNT_0008275235 /DNA_START=740 /DNA_END=862 /DNA_ORIENTATION=+